MRTARLLLVVMVGLAAASGCGKMYTCDADRFLNLTAGKGYDRGLVICLSGAGGATGEVDRIHRGLVDGGVACAIESFGWSGGEVISDQTSINANKEKAKILACRIEKYQQEHPDCPVHLIGVSAGTGLLVWAVEDLSPGHRVENTFLIASSLWREYDLTAALGNAHGRMYNYHSPADLVLALFVPLISTVDRKNGISGGLHGFQPPANADERTKALYEARLEQIRWKSRDSIYGHIGDHLGGTSPGYVREYIAPLTWAKKPETNVATAREVPTTATTGAGN